MLRYIPVEVRFEAEQVELFQDMSTASETGRLSVYVGEARVFSAPAVQVLDGPIEVTVEDGPKGGKVLAVTDSTERVYDEFDLVEDLCGSRGRCAWSPGPEEDYTSPGEGPYA